MQIHPRRLSVTVEQVLASYAETKSSHKTATELGISASAVLRWLKLAGVAAEGLTKYREAAAEVSAELGQQVAASYADGQTLVSLSKQHGASIYGLKKAILRAGGTLRKNLKSEVSPETVAEIVGLYEAGMTQAEIGLKVGRPQSSICLILRGAGITTYKDKGGARSKGHKAKGGYMQVFLPLTDPLACMRGFSGYVLEHRLVMARKLDRPLTPDETVHHIDGNPSNNAPSNLQLRQGKHGKGVVHTCRDCGSHNVATERLATLE
jgi:transposase-like protein